MKTMLLIAGAAVIGLTAGAAQAATHHRSHHATASAGAYAEPAQPIAYTQLSAYLKASPRAKKTGDWGGQMAATTGANVNAAATSAAPPPATDNTAPNPQQPANPPAPAPATQPPSQ